MMKSKKLKLYILFAVAMVLQSFASVFTKLAGMQDTFSLKFFLYYGFSLCIVGGFSICWQLILEKIPLTTAYLRKGITYILILTWSVLIFGETITWNNVLGSAIIIIGLVVSVRGD